MSAYQQEDLLFCVAIVVLLAGTVSVVITRLGQKPENQICYACFFYACLGLVASMCLLATWTGTGSWILNGFTLAMMAVGATLDTGGTPADSIL